VALAALSVAMLLAVSVSLGASNVAPPRFTEVLSKEVFSTRALIGLVLRPENLATKFSAEYSTTSPSGPWTKVNEKEIPSGQESEETVWIGVQEKFPQLNGRFPFLRGLEPGTSYYARFLATNSEGTTEDVIPFETLPVEKPEIDIDSSSFMVDPTIGVTDMGFGFEAEIEANGAAATYHFEYAEHESGPWKEFSSGATGTISAAEEYAVVKAQTSGLTPERKYYVRLKASNTKGETEADEYEKGPSAAYGCQYLDYSCGFLVTPSAKPYVGQPDVRNVTADSAHVVAHFAPHGLETDWRLEYTSEPGNAGSWKPVPGGSGTVSLAQAEVAGYRNPPLRDYGVPLSGLQPATTYYVRTFAQNTAGEAEYCFKENEAGPKYGQEVCEPASSETRGVVSFTTQAPVAASASVVHGVHGEALRLLGSVNPNSAPTADEQTFALEGSPTGGTFTLTLAGQTTAPLTYDASQEQVKSALEALPAIAQEVSVEGGFGLYTVRFATGASVAQMTGDGSGLTGPGTGAVKVETIQAGGEGYGAHYQFEYVGQQSFAAHGWAEAVQGPEGHVAVSASPVFEGYDLVGVTPGESYRYRVLAQSDAPGALPVESEEQSLTIPLPQAVGGGGEAACPNAGSRVEASAHLPDCRAYEQLTPVDKHGAEEPFQYQIALGGTVPVGADGEHIVLEAPNTYYLAGPETGQSPFLFSREPSGWGMLAGALQPETGVSRDYPQVYSADVTQVAFSSEYSLSDVGVSPTVEYRLGPVGGPYTTVASVPRAETTAAEGWVAGTPSLSKLVFGTQDRTLTSEQVTGTTSGSDLYEYTPDGGLRQLNVTGAEGETQTIGSCGAQIAKGVEDYYEKTNNSGGGPHSLSGDGSRVFFEAVPGKNCSAEAKHLYMRVNGAETVDVGEYTFLAANADGSRVLLQSEDGAHEALLYDSETETATSLPGLGGLEKQQGKLTVSSDLGAAYFTRGDDLYRYDIAAGRLEFLMGVTGSSQGVALYTSPDGRYLYLEAAAVGGLPAGGGVGDEAVQVYRYDSFEHAVQCISCASPFDSEPRLPSFLSSVASKTFINGGGPLYSSISGNGQYAFFTTPAALVPSDIDGETKVETDGSFSPNREFADVFQRTSPSSDVYEWRAQGVHGCAQLAGCLSLISNGRGGFMTILLGAADEGRDVFLYTREELSLKDSGSEANIFDAREGGGESPPPPSSLECEGDSCATPPAAPLDSTPSSMTFSGVGNAVGSPVSKPAQKPNKPKKPKPKSKSTKHKGKRKNGAKSKGKRQSSKRGSRKYAVAAVQPHQAGIHAAQSRAAGSPVRLAALVRSW